MGHMDIVDSYAHIRIGLLYPNQLPEPEMNGIEIFL